MAPASGRQGTPMHSRAAELLNLLGMRPHPEGGHYVELFRSVDRVQVLGRKVERTALTTIYFLLVAGEFSRWHRVLFDERGLRRTRLGPVAGETQPTVVVPAGTWQAARAAGAYTLVACTVGPGFEFADFSLAVDWPDVASRIANAGPDVARFI